MPPNPETDALITNQLMEMTKGNALLTTTHYLECVTPELQHLLKRSLTECLQVHDRTTELAVKNGWYPAYQSINQQLEDDLSVVKAVQSQHHQFS